MESINPVVRAIIGRIARKQPGQQPETDFGTGDDSTMVDRLPSYSQPQPEDATAARVAESAGIQTAPQITPRYAFDRAMEVGAQNPQPPGRVARPTTAVAQTQPQAASQPGYEDIPPPPKPPQLQPVQSSTPMPTRTIHGQAPGDNRFKDAARSFGRTLIMSGLNPVAALGSFAGTLIDPQASHDRKYNQEFRKWAPGAKAERDAIEDANKGKIQQAQADNVYYDNVTGRDRMIDTRISRGQRTQDRATQAQDRERNITREETQNRLSKQQRDHLFRMTDADTGEESVYNYDTNERTVVPGVSGRIQREPREPRGPDYQAPHVVLNEALSDKDKFENMKDKELPKARGRVQELKTVLQSLEGDDDKPAAVSDPEIAAILSAMPGASKADKRTAVAAQLQKAQGEADQLQKRMHTHISDMKTKYAKHGRFFEAGGDGDYPYVKLHPEVLEQGEDESPAPRSGGKRTGLLDVPGRIKR